MEIAQAVHQIVVSLVHWIGLEILVGAGVTLAVLFIRARCEALRD